MGQELWLDGMPTVSENLHAIRLALGILRVGGGGHMVDLTA